MRALHALATKFRKNAQHRAEGFQREVERVLGITAKEKQVSLKNAYAYSRSILTCSMLRLEAHVAAITILVMAIGTSIFIPYDATDFATRVSVISVAMLAGTSISILVLYLLLPIHLLANISLWSIAAIHILIAATIFSQVEPEIIRYLHPYPVPTRLEIFVPYFLMSGLVDIFILWLFKPRICLRSYKRRHKAETVKAILSAQKQNKIWVISAADHYVEFITKHGREMHRMTMKSAAAKTSEGEGLRVHRSHWVAFRAMLSLAKEGERYFLTLRNGQKIPVSKNIAPEVQQYLERDRLHAPE